MRLRDSDNNVLLDTKAEDAKTFKWPCRKKKCQVTGANNEFTVKSIEMDKSESIVSAKINTADWSAVDIKFLIYSDAIQNVDDLFF